MVKQKDMEHDEQDKKSKKYRLSEPQKSELVMLFPGYYVPFPIGFSHILGKYILAMTLLR